MSKSLLKFRYPVSTAPPQSTWPIIDSQKGIRLDRHTMAFIFIFYSSFTWIYLPGGLDPHFFPRVGLTDL